MLRQLVCLLEMLIVSFLRKETNKEVNFKRFNRLIHQPLVLWDLSCQVQACIFQRSRRFQIQIEIIINQTNLKVNSNNLRRRRITKWDQNLNQTFEVRCLKFLFNNSLNKDRCFQHRKCLINLRKLINIECFRIIIKIVLNMISSNISTNTTPYSLYNRIFNNSKTILFNRHIIIIIAIIIIISYLKIWNNNLLKDIILIFKREDQFLKYLNFVVVITKMIMLTNLLILILRFQKVREKDKDL